MSKEPYYSSSSSTSYIKPANARSYTASHLDLPSINNKLIIPPVKFAKNEILEPYYYKQQKIQTLPPILTNIFQYTYEKNIDIQDCAIIDEDEEDEFYLAGFEISAPESSLSRKVSDNYTNRMLLDTDNESLISYNDLACSESNCNIPSCVTKVISPPDVNDINELKLTLQEKIDNPNVITNAKSRSLSMSLLAPKLTQEKSMVFADLLQDSSYKIDLSDDYQSAKVEFLV